MIVVADTSPICYLILIDQIDLLFQIYGSITIPTIVQAELKSSNAPQSVQDWIRQPPPWLNIQLPHQPPDSSLNRLDPGEQAAIALAEQLGANLLLIDERMGRQIAQQRGLNIIGLIGVLDEAATRKLIDVSTIVDRLQQTTFRISPRMLESLIQKHSV